MMIKRHPRLSIWSAPLFNDPEYLAYKSDLEQSIAITPPPEDLLLSRAMPHLHNYIRQTHADVMQQVNHNNQLLQQHVNVFNQAMGDLANGRLTISVQWAPNSSAAPNDSSVSATPSSSSMPPPSPINISTLTPSVNLPQHPHQPVTTPSTITTPSQQSPHYILSSGVCTTQDLWREWHDGLSGGPAIKDLENQWGTVWRKNQSKKYNRRKRVIEGVKAYIELHMLQVDEALKMVEYWRKNPKPEWYSGGVKERSLHWMGENKDKWEHVEKAPISYTNT
ncbi:transcriptional activator of glycolytic enzymes-domain-containing protein [Circinella umbellata]|nr:transcriptional activator of glycolytic enzymes-domain-containing protein [Circinella umbellata]